MSYLINLFYLVALAVLSPWLVYKALTTGKYRRGVWSKLTGRTGLGRTSARSQLTIWFHGVSVGEIHLLRQVVAAFRQRHPTWRCVISTTTDTGYDEARKHFSDLEVIWWPADFTWSVKRALAEVQPNIVVLAECELWPNFLRIAGQRGVKVGVINGRMSLRSFARYRRLGCLFRRLFASVDLFAVQTGDYARRYRKLGAAPDRVHVTNSVKYDGVLGYRNGHTENLSRLLVVQPDDLIWIAGSTQAPEEEIVLEIYSKLRRDHPNLRLYLVPRQKDRFDEVAGLLHRWGGPFVRRSQLQAPLTDLDAVVLVDTIGELGPLWGLADIAFVGGSLDGRRGGQNMIEPAAFGAAVVFGPHVWNFRDTAARLVDAGAALQVSDASELEEVIGRLCSDPRERAQLGQAARQLVVNQQGATVHTMRLLDQLVDEAGTEASRLPCTYRPDPRNPIFLKSSGHNSRITP